MFISFNNCYAGGREYRGIGGRHSKDKREAVVKDQTLGLQCTWEMSKVIKSAVVFEAK